MKDPKRNKRTKLACKPLIPERQFLGQFTQIETNIYFTLGNLSWKSEE